MTKQPRLLNADLTERARLLPSAMSARLELSDMPTASMTLTEDQPEIGIHDWVEVYTPKGSAGIFRATNVEDTKRSQRVVTLLHGIDCLNDSVWDGSEEYEGTVRAFVTALLAKQRVRRWQLGICAITGQWKKTINYDHLSDLLNEIRDENPNYYFAYDFSTSPWTLNILAKPMNVSSEFRLARNIEEVQITRADGSQCNRLYLSVNQKVTENDVTKTETEIKTYNNAASQAAYGIIEKTADIDLEDVPDADEWAAKFLSERAHPEIMIRISGWALWQITGETWDEAKLGELARVALPEYREALDERVECIEYPELIFGTPGGVERVNIELANRAPTFSETIANIGKEAEKAGKTARGAARGGASAEELESWSMVVTKHGDTLDGSGVTELYETGIELDAESGARIYSLAQGFVSNYAELKVHNSEISTLVRKTGINALGENETLATKISQTAEKVSIIATDGDIDKFIREGGTGSMFSVTRDSITAAVGDITAAQGQITEIKGTGLWQNRESITAVAGKFEVDGNDVRLKDGAQLKVTKNGVQAIVGTVNEINSVDSKVTEITGSTLWAQRTSITGVVGKFEIDGSDVRLKDGAQLKITKNGVQSVVGTVNEINSVNSKVTEVTGSTLWAQKDSITGVVGKFEIDGNNVRLKTGAQLQIKESGVYQTVGTVTQSQLSGVSGRVTTIEGSALWAQESSITGVVGKFEVDGNNVRLKTGAQLQIKESGVYQTVGTVTQSQLSGVSGRVTTIEGSALWAQESSITGVVGKFEVDGNNVRLKTGAQLQIKEDGVYQTVGTVTQTQLSGVSGRVTTIEGSTLWAQESGITALAGKMHVSQRGNVILDEGAGLYVTVDGVNQEFATKTYTNGRLTTITGSDLWINRDGITALAGKMSVSSRGNVVLDEGAGLYVTNDGVKTQVIDKSGVISSINQTSESVTINASKINLSGYVTASQLSAQKARIDDLISGNTVANRLACTEFVCGSLKIGSYSYTEILVYDQGGNLKWVLGRK